jgi:hypothetical protein
MYLLPFVTQGGRLLLLAVLAELLPSAVLLASSVKENDLFSVSCDCRTARFGGVF